MTKGMNVAKENLAINVDAIVGNVEDGVVYVRHTTNGGSIYKGQKVNQKKLCQMQCKR